MSGKKKNAIKVGQEYIKPKTMKYAIKVGQEYIEPKRIEITNMSISPEEEEIADELAKEIERIINEILYDIQFINAPKA